METLVSTGGDIVMLPTGGVIVLLGICADTGWAWNIWHCVLCRWLDVGWLHSHMLWCSPVTPIMLCWHLDWWEAVLCTAPCWLVTVWYTGSGNGGREYWMQAVGWLLTGAEITGPLVGGDKRGPVLMPVLLLVSPSVICTGLCPPSLMPSFKPVVVPGGELMGVYFCSSVSVSSNRRPSPCIAWSWGQPGLPHLSYPIISAYCPVGFAA
jgi:hypothetical protein